MSLRSISAVVACTFGMSGCLADPDGKANTLYAEASRAMTMCTTEADNYTDALDLYSSARASIERILADFSSTQIAVDLYSGNTKISGWSLDAFRDLKYPLKASAELEKSPLALALHFADKDVPDERAKVLSAIAGRYAAAGQDEQADQLLSRALATPRLRLPQQTKVAALTEVAGNYGAVRKRDQASQLLFEALKEVRAIADPLQRTRALAAIANSHGTAGQGDEGAEVLSEAVEGAEAIKYPWPRAIAFRDIAKAYAEIGRFNEALALVEAISTEERKLTELGQDIHAYAETGNLDQAMRLLAEVAELNTKLAKAGVLDLDRGKARIKRTASRIRQVFAESLATNLPYGDVGQLGRARELVDSIDDAADKVMALVAVAEGYAEAGRQEHAAQVLSLAIETAETIASPQDKPMVLAKIAGAYAKVGDISRASEIADNVNSSPASESVVKALFEIAEKYIEAGEPQEAALIVGQAIAMADSVKAEKFWGLEKIAGKYADSGQLTQALAAVESMETKDEMRDGWRSSSKGSLVFRKGKALAAIAGKYTEAGELPQALLIAENIEDLGWKSAVLGGIAAEYAGAGREPSDQDKLTLKRITQKTSPILLFWKVLE